MTNYKVNVNHADGSYAFSLDLKVKHFRQYDGRVPNTCGGHSAIFEVNSGLVFSSKCRDDEQFSRRKGLLTSLQKLLLSKSFHRNNDKLNYYIQDVVFESNGCTIWIGGLNENGGAFWWLTGGDRLGSGLYTKQV
jgi:hypothetical protein